MMVALQAASLSHPPPINHFLRLLLAPPHSFFHKKKPIHTSLAFGNWKFHNIFLWKHLLKSSKCWRKKTIAKLLRRYQGRHAGLWGKVSSTNMYIIHPAHPLYPRVPSWLCPCILFEISLYKSHPHEISLHSVYVMWWLTKIIPRGTKSMWYYDRS